MDCVFLLWSFLDPSHKLTILFIIIHNKLILKAFLLIFFRNYTIIKCVNLRIKHLQFRKTI